MWLTIAFLCLSFSSSSASEGSEFCRRHGSGRYCKEDLSGYRKCGGWWGRSQLLADVKCPEGNRCSCFLNNDCDFIETDDWFSNLKDEEICKPLDKAFPVEEVLHLNYTRTGWEDVNPFEDYVYYRISGVIKQDLYRMSRVKTWTDHVTKKSHFELVIPDSERSGTFSKFHGTYPDTCKKQTMKSFDAFGGEIQNFQLDKASTVKLDEKLEQQVWHNYVFHYRTEPGRETKWTVVQDSERRRVTPVRYFDQYTGTQEEQCCGHQTIIEYEDILEDDEPDRDDWFEIPDFCSW